MHLHICQAAQDVIRMALTCSAHDRGRCRGYGDKLAEYGGIGGSGVDTVRHRPGAWSGSPEWPKVHCLRAVLSARPEGLLYVAPFGATLKPARSTRAPKPRAVAGFETSTC